LNWALETGIIVVEGEFVDWFDWIVVVVGGEERSLTGRCL